MRSVQCLAGGRPAAGCSVLQKPTVSQACNTRFCPIAEKKGECRGPPPRLGLTFAIRLGLSGFWSGC